MAVEIIYTAGTPPHAIDDTADYARFKTVWGGMLSSERLAFADRLAERARLLRKNLLNLEVISANQASWHSAGGDYTPGDTDPPTPYDPIGYHEAVTVVNAAVNCFKAANLHGV